MRFGVAAACVLGLFGCGSSGDADDAVGETSTAVDASSGTTGPDPTTVTDGPAPESSGAVDTSDGGGTTGAPLPCGDDPSLSANEQMLVDMPADSWTSAPASDLMTICGPVADEFDGIALVIGCRGIVDAWGGGAWDPLHRQMLVWGGGHADYGGNEIYGFDVASFAWQRLTDPTLPPFDMDPLPDGNPVSRHTYGGLQWLTDAQRFFAVGGSMATSGNGTNLTWLFDVDAAQWTNAAPPEAPPVSFSHSTAYDAAAQTVLLRVSQSLWSYDVAGNAWTKLQDFGYPPLWPDFERGGDKTGVIDPTRGIFWSFGGNDHLVYDIAANAMVHQDWVTTGGGVFDNSAELESYPEQWYSTGGGDVIAANAPGVDYDPKADALVAWFGGTPYVLDLAAKTWTTKSAAGAPPTAVENGTYGRWRYASAYNVFVLVNRPDEDVFFYKHTAGCGP